MRIPNIVIFCGEIDCDATYSSGCLAKPQKIQSFRSATKITGTASDWYYHGIYTLQSRLRRLLSVLSTIVGGTRPGGNRLSERCECSSNVHLRWCRGRIKGLFPVGGAFLRDRFAASGERRRRFGKAPSAGMFCDRAVPRRNASCVPWINAALRGRLRLCLSCRLVGDERHVAVPRLRGTGPL